MAEVRNETPRDVLDRIWRQVADLVRKPCDETEWLFDNLCGVRDVIEDGFDEYRLALGRASADELAELRRQAALAHRPD